MIGKCGNYEKLIGPVALTVSREAIKKLGKNPDTYYQKLKLGKE